MVMPRMVGETDKARYGAALAQRWMREDALKRSTLDHGVFPTTAQGLEALVRRPAVGTLAPHWPEGGSLEKQEGPKDPWGNASISLSPGQHSPDDALQSFGADGLAGGAGYHAAIDSWRVSRCVGVAMHASGLRCCRAWAWPRGRCGGRHQQRGPRRYR